MLGPRVALCLTSRGAAKRFHSRGPTFHPPPCGRAPVSPRPRRHLCSPVFLLAILVGVKWHLVVVFNFIFQMTNDIKHLFMCLLVTRMSSLEKCKGLVLRSFSFSVKCPKTLNHGGAGHTPQSYEGAQRMQRVRIGSARAVFPLPCAVWLQL